MIGTTQLAEAFCQATHVGMGPYDDSYAYDTATGKLVTKAGQAFYYGDTNHKHAVTTWNGRTYTYDANGKPGLRPAAGKPCRWRRRAQPL